jgi:polynucleotide 5'-hydroxyl-kinase GRC3/NOL9
MNRTVEKGKTLLAEGPSSVTIISGKAEVFGSTVKAGNKIVIREGKRLPFTTQENTVFDISTGENAEIEETEGSTIPSSWVTASQELQNVQTRPTVAIVLGNVDSGKTSFTTYLLNRLVKEKKKTAILDGDIGQSDVGPPCTVAYTFVRRQLTDLFNLETKQVRFIGVNSPSGIISKVINALNTLKNEIIQQNPDFVVVDTDGWIEGEDAVYYKTRLVETLCPDITFMIQQKDELAPLVNTLEKFAKVIVNSPVAINQRDREKRKNLRELGYVKYLRNAKVQSYPLSWLRIEESEPIGLDRIRENMKEPRKLNEMFGMKPLHVVEFRDRISVIIGRRRWIGQENIKKVEESTGKKVMITRKGEEEGLLTGLYDPQRKFLGIGIMQEIYFKRKVLKILTPVSGEISTVFVGKVKLDKNLREIPTLDEQA